MDVFYRCEKPLEVYTMVTVKTFVFSIDEGLDDNGGDIFVLDRSSVLAEKTADKYTVGTVYLGRFISDRIFNVFKSGRLPEQVEKVEVNGNEK